MEIGLFFGSFNPIHVGHLIIANTMAEHAELGQVWFVVSPQNPHKKSKSLLHEFDRLQMVRVAIADNDKFHATDIEFHMPRPSYTADTLAYLSDKFPQHRFNIILGEDNLKNFPKWKNHKVILENHGLLVYPRPGSTSSDLTSHPQVKMVDAPKVDISATFIRTAIKNHKSIRYLVHEEVIQYIESKKLYY